jgi:hypothetical protein
MRRPVLHLLALAALAVPAAAQGAPPAAAKAAAVRPAAGPASGAATPVANASRADTGAASASVTRRVVPRRELTVYRESYAYDDAGRRDPFVSLLGSSELRPMLSDLRLAVVVFDRQGGSRAVLRDVNARDAQGKASGPQYYTVRVGQTLGRMRVAAIGPKSVTFTILEFGESRQETLVLNDSTSVRTTP